MTYFKLLSKHLPAGPEENHKTSVRKASNLAEVRTHYHQNTRFSVLPLYQPDQHLKWYSILCVRRKYLVQISVSAPATLNPFE
jgi:hypothetical protein